MVATGTAAEHIAFTMTIIMPHPHSPMSKDTGPVCHRMDTEAPFRRDTVVESHIPSTAHRKCPLTIQTIITDVHLRSLTVGIRAIICSVIAKPLGNAFLVAN